MGTDVLGIDPGSHCGWCVLDKSGNVLALGQWELKGGRFDGYGMRFVRLRSYLTEMFTAYPGIAKVGFEEVRAHMGVDAAHIYGGVISTLTAFLEERKLPYMGIPVGTAKKRATGKGNADKAAMIAAAKLAIPSSGGDMTDNMADAYWIATCTLEAK